VKAWSRFGEHIQLRDDGTDIGWTARRSAPTRNVDGGVASDEREAPPGIREQSGPRVHGDWKEQCRRPDAFVALTDTFVTRARRRVLALGCT
jgi:hypothetical protein